MPIAVKNKDQDTPQALIEKLRSYKKTSGYATTTYKAADLIEQLLVENLKLKVINSKVYNIVKKVSNNLETEIKNLSK